MLTGRIPTTQRVLKKAEERPACVAKCSGAAARLSCLLKVSFAFAQASVASVVECCVRCRRESDPVVPQALREGGRETRWAAYGGKELATGLRVG